jgi:hypothetical protein
MASAEPPCHWKRARREYSDPISIVLGIKSLFPAYIPTAITTYQKWLDPPGISMLSPEAETQTALKTAEIQCRAEDTDSTA